MTKASSKLGRRGEDAAAAYLERIGYEILERNWRDRSGEIDIIALDGCAVVLCEVKTRTSTAKGVPEESITPTKMRRYARLARAYTTQAGLCDSDVRFDVITLLVLAPDRALLRHHRAAFVCGD